MLYSFYGQICNPGPLSAAFWSLKSVIVPHSSPPAADKASLKFSSRLINPEWPGVTVSIYHHRGRGRWAVYLLSPTEKEVCRASPPRGNPRPTEFAFAPQPVCPASIISNDIICGAAELHCIIRTGCSVILFTSGTLMRCVILHTRLQD